MNYNEIKINNIKKQFFEKKFVILKNFLTLSEVDLLLSDYKRFQDNEFGSKLKRQEKTRFVFGQLPGELGQIYKNEKILKIIQSILGENIALYFQRLMIKDPSAPQTVTPHQDMPYFHGTPEKITVFIFLSGNKKEDGGMVFVPSSSQFGLLPRGNLNLENLPNLPYCSPELSTRDIVISDFFTWHWSWPQVNPTDRPIIQLAYQKSDDGSFEDKFIGSPMLVSGKWQTEHFVSASKVVPSEKLNTPNSVLQISEKEYEIECGL